MKTARTISALRSDPHRYDPPCALLARRVLLDPGAQGLYDLAGLLGAGNSELGLLAVFAARFLVAPDDIFVRPEISGFRLPLLVTEKDGGPGAFAQHHLVQFVDHDLAVFLKLYGKIVNGFVQNCLAVRA